MPGQGGLINQLRRLRQHDRVEALRPVEFGVPQSQRLEDRLLRLGRGRLEPLVPKQNVLQARLLDNPVALTFAMVPGVFHPRRITTPWPRSRSGSAYSYYSYD